MQDSVEPNKRGNWYKKLRECKTKLGKTAMREPRDYKQVVTRLQWDRLYLIMTRRYNDYE